MDMLENIKISLNDNPNLSKEVKDDIFELVIIFNNNFPEVDLKNLQSRLATLKIEKISKFLNKDVSLYDNKKNVLYFNISEMDNGYDMRHVLMFELLNIISSNNAQMGFNLDNKFEALNIGYTEILANYLVGNNSDKMLFADEAIATNLISVMIGSDKLFEAYFKNDARILIESFNSVGVLI